MRGGKQTLVCPRTVHSSTVSINTEKIKQTLNIEQLIDNRNENLWTELNREHSITVELTDEPHYGVYSINDESTIYVTRNNLNIASFTHELLHIQIRLKEIYFGPSFELLVRESPELSGIITQQLTEHIGNCMSHILMLPTFIELGFDKKEFIEDYDENKCTKKELQDLKAIYKVRGVYNATAIDFYIAKFIAIKADPKQHINYPKALSELKKLDTGLYNILEKCVLDWKNMPLTKENPWDDDHNSISFELFESLCEWTRNKIIV